MVQVLEQLLRNEKESWDDASTTLLNSCEGFTKFEKCIFLMITVSFVTFFHNIENINRSKRKLVRNLVERIWQIE